MVEADWLNRDHVIGEDEGDRSGAPDAVWVVATDSEYVVKGMTEWLPAWKVNLIPYDPQALLHSR